MYLVSIIIIATDSRSQSYYTYMYVSNLSVTLQRSMVQRERYNINIVCTLV